MDSTDTSSPSPDPKIAGGGAVLIFAPHPDDESLACAGIISRALEAGRGVKIAVVTNGDAFEEAYSIWSERERGDMHKNYIDYGYHRQRETVSALQILGLSADNIIFLGYPDRGLYHLVSSNWNSPYFSVHTHTDHSPYTSSLTPNTKYTGKNLLKDIKHILGSFHPSDIYLPHAHDTHADHKATNYFVYRAFKELRREHAERSVPRFHEYFIHKGKNWPYPRGYTPGLDLSPPEGMPSPDEVYELTESMKDKKKLAIETFSTQMAIFPDYLLSFVRANEIFWSGNPRTSVSFLYFTPLHWLVNRFSR